MAANHNPLPRIIPAVTLATAAVGIAVEIAAHELLRTRHAVWLIKPYLFAALPKPFVRTDWLSVALLAAAVMLLVLIFKLVRWEALSKPARFGLGLFFGGAIGDSTTGVALGTITSIFVARRGSWGHAFGPFDVAVLIGFVLFAPDFRPGSRLMLGAKGRFRWRDLL